MDPAMVGAARHPETTDTTQTCSKCKKMTIGSKRMSIHKTLAYTRCRCHRLFRYQNNRHSMSRVSITPSIPGSINISASNMIIQGKQLDSRSVTKNYSSPPTHNISRTDSRITATLDSELTLPRIERQHLRVTDLSASAVTADRSAGYSGTDIKFTKLAPKTNAQLLLESTAKLSLPRLPQLSRENEDSCHPTKQKTDRVGVSKLTDIVQFIPSTKRNELRLLFKHFDKDGDGHLSLMEFMGCLPCTRTRRSDTEFLKQLHAGLSSETYFGVKEFTLGYCIAENLSKRLITSTRLKQEYQLEENFMDVLTLFMINLAKKSSKGFVSISAVTEAASTIKVHTRPHHNPRFLPPVLAEIAPEGQLHLVQCLSFSPYFLCI